MCHDTTEQTADDEACASTLHALTEHYSCVKATVGSDKQHNVLRFACCTWLATWHTPLQTVSHKIMRQIQCYEHNTVSHTQCPPRAEEEGEEEEEEKTKKVKTTVWDWETLNDSSALWLRSPTDVPAEDYNKFYKALVKVPPSDSCKQIVHPDQPRCRLLQRWVGLPQQSRRYAQPSCLGPEVPGGRDSRTCVTL